jgi:CHAD domain-containing protein
MAAAQLRSAYRRIVKAANAVTAHPPADELHQLRRHCKRMRYLLDGYESVYPAQPHRQVLATLKKLQDCLGDIQDSDVQRRQLAESTVALIRRGTPVDTVLALGALRERTSLRDAAARQDLTRWLRRVCGPVTRAHVDAVASAPSS